MLVKLARGWNLVINWLKFENIEKSKKLEKGCFKPKIKGILKCTVH